MASYVLFKSGHGLCYLVVKQFNIMKHLFALAPMALAGLILSSCECSEGPAGSNGNANVRRVDITVNSGDWSEQGSAGQSDHAWVAVVTNIEALTESIANNGFVMVYKQDNFLGETVYTPLPYVENFSANQRIWEFQYAPGDIGFSVKDTDLNTPEPTSSITYKVVLIEGSALKTDALAQMSYVDAMAYLGLQP